MKAKHVFYDCPGAWVGAEGRVTVDCAKTLDALAFLRRRVSVTAVKPSRRWPDGIVIEYEKRP